MTDAVGHWLNAAGRASGAAWRHPREGCGNQRSEHGRGCSWWREASELVGMTLQGRAIASHG